MKKLIFCLSLPWFLSSCASFKKAFCDCQPSAPTKVVTDRTSKPVKLVKQKKSKTQDSIVVDEEDLKLADRMTKAVDEFVFKDEEGDFKSLCAEKRFDCWVNEKPYPAGKHLEKRRVPPFLTGTKMGLRGEERVQVRFNFYP